MYTPTSSNVVAGDTITAIERNAVRSDAVQALRQASGTVSNFTGSQTITLGWQPRFVFIFATSQDWTGTIELNFGMGDGTNNLGIHSSTGQGRMTFNDKVAGANNGLANKLTVTLTSDGFTITETGTETWDAGYFAMG